MIPITTHSISGVDIVKQKGSALIISLIILLVLTMLGVQGMQSSTLEEKMSGNFRDSKMAFEAAEAGLKAGEIWLNLQSAPPLADGSGTNGIWTFGNASVHTYSFWSGVAVSTTSLPGLSANPKFIIEERGVQAGSGQNRSAEIGANSKSNWTGTSYGYRITARGTGGSTNAVVILQSDFEKIY